MDMSGFAGLAAQDELNERQDKRETHSGLNAPGFMTGVASQKTTLSFTEDNHGACAVMDNGELACWGQGSDYLIFNNGSSSLTPVVRENFPVGLSVSEISLGGNHRCALMINSKVYCWGSGAPAFTAPSGFVYDRPSPTVVQDIYGNDILATQVDSGDHHSCAILTNGSTVCWGYNYYGQLGAGYRCVTGAEGICIGVPDYSGDLSEYIEQPMEVILPTGRTVVALNIWYHNSCFVLDDGSYMCAGSSFDYASTPIHVTYSDSNASTVIAAHHETVIMTGAGYYGNGESHKVSTGPNPFIQTSPMGGSYYNSTGSYQGDVHYENVVSSSALTSNYGCVLMNNGSVHCASADYITSYGVTEYVWMDIPSGVEASAVVGNPYTRCIVYSNGSAQCWGHNNIGQIGAGYACVYGSSDPNDCNSENSVETPRWISLPAGRHIALSEADSDADEIWDLHDQCPSSSLSWTSNTTNDYDQDGCRDVDEDDDDDNDGHLDSIDAFPLDETRYRIWTADEIGRPGVANDAITINRCNYISESGVASVSSPQDNQPDSWSLHNGPDGSCINGVLNETGSYTYIGGSPTITSVTAEWSILVEIVGGGGARCGLLASNGTLACFGEGGYGLLGQGNTTDSWNELTYPELPFNSKVKYINTIYQSIFVTLENGQVYAWGANHYNFLGVGFSCGGSSNIEFGCIYNSGYLSKPSRVTITGSGSGSGEDFTNITQITASNTDVYTSWTTVCALNTDGEVLCRGGQSNGQDGDGTLSISQSYLSKAILPNNVTDIAQGYSHTCALLDNGSVYCFGENTQGQMGDGTTCEPLDFSNGCNGAGHKPVADAPVALPAGRKALQIWGYMGSFTVAFLDDGTKWVWGEGNPTPYQNSDSDFFPAQSTHDRDGDGVDNLLDNCGNGLSDWTSNSSNDVDGDGCFDATEDTDDDGDGFSDTTESECNTNPLDSSIYPIDTDLDGICNANDLDDDADGVLDTEDFAPMNRYGYQEIGLGSGFHPGASSDNVTFGASNQGTCIIANDSKIYCWGRNSYGQIGDGTDNIYRPVPTMANLPSTKIPVSISEGDGNHVCSVMDDGTLYCWGKNTFGQLGVGSICDSDSYANGCNGDRGISSPSLVNLPQGLTAKAVSTGEDFTCAILSDDRVYCWGLNASGQVGNGSTGGSTTTPSEVLLPTERSALSITSGTYHSCAVMDDSSLFCWGSNYYGAVGNGISGGSISTPEQVILPANETISMASVGYRQTCVVSTTNIVYCWGYGSYVYQSNSSSTGWYQSNSYSPVMVSISGGQAVTIGVGDRFACAILSNENLYCWGSDSSGRLGANHGGGVHGPTIVTMPDNQNTVALSVGYSHSCALTDDNSLVCWGSHNHQNGIIGTGNSYDDNFNEINYYNTPQYVEIPIGIFTETNTRDMDEDGIFNHQDLCPNGETDWTSDSTTDYDQDGCQDSSEDLDDDNDYLLDTEEDANGNGVWDQNNETNWLDADTDDDGYNDGIDDLPLDGTEWLDSDQDGIGDNSDTDDDNDAWLDTLEVMCGTDPLDSSDFPEDYDGDGNCDYVDQDDDGDGTSDSSDDFPFDSYADTDTDGDGMPDNVSHYDFNDIPTNGLIGYWNMDESSGNPTDSSTEQHTSVMHGNPIYGENGRSGSAISFDGDGDYIEIDADDAFNVTNITISAWVKLSDLAVNPWQPGALVCRGNGFEEVWCIDLISSSNNTYYRFWHRHSDLNWSYSPVLTTTPLNLTWNHVAVTYDGTFSNIYLNGVLDGSIATGLGNLSSSNESVYIATRQNAQSGGLPINVINASIDEVRIYNRALNSTEIGILYLSTTLVRDTDDDNDGWSDEEELACGDDPQNANDIPQDTDLDGYCDNVDAYPLDPSEWQDSDGDGVGDNSDAFPYDANETTDTDGDGMGDNSDPDADNDGWSNVDEVQCLTNPLDQSSIPGDIDGDGICDALEMDLDNDGWSNANETACGTDFDDINSVPVDTDGDWICDIMDPDDDGDLVNDEDDEFPLDGTEWSDFDGDGSGDNSDPDDDNDGCMDIVDDMPFDPTECYDTDGDGTGDNVDNDDDGDNVTDENDAFPLDPSASVDTDGDGMPDTITGNSTTGLVEDMDDDNDGWDDTTDAFPLDSTEWADFDQDGLGDNEDLNDDGDACVDTLDEFPYDGSECYDTDGDGVGNNADPDDDNDGWLDSVEDICGTSDPLNASSIPNDNDGDGVCDLLDLDDDNDNYIDGMDAFPFDPCAAVDTDQDGEPDWIYLNCNTTLTEDLDDDNDGYLDANDTFPQDPTEWGDFDGDGIGDNSDSDIDGDQVPNQWDMFPYNSTEWGDNDGDGIGDNADLDDDNDGVPDVNDAFPLDAAASVDTDGDGMPDTLVGNVTTSLVEDDDDDGDGVLDIYDWAPLDPSEWVDTDGDGVGDNADADDDGDGWSDSDEYICGSNHLDANSVPPDGDGDGICDSEDDSDTSTLSGRIQYYMNSPVTVWMAVVGVLCALVIGATGSSLRSAKERRMLVQQTIDYSDSVSGHEEFGSIAVGQVEIPIPKMTPSQVGRQELVQKYLNQGYSSEVANILADDELNN